jgi:Calcineurin-like phosphoesterase/Polyketide cyclase / dehydrase and lipid transport
MKTFVLGDIHGVSRALDQCMDRSVFDFENDCLIQLGDVVDGYADVYECVETLLRVKHLIALKGNHDDWFLEFIRTGYHPTGWNFGGKATALVLPLFIKKEYTVEQKVVISKPDPVVFDFVKILGNQTYYNKWVMMDPKVKRTGTGIDGTVGFISAWDSNVRNVGKGEQEITRILQGSQIDSKVRFEKPFKNVADVQMTTKAIAAGQTELTWTMRGQNKYPMNLMNLFIPNLLVRDIAESLNNLKSVLEKGA